MNEKGNDYECFCFLPAGHAVHATAPDELVNELGEHEPHVDCPELD